MTPGRSTLSLHLSLVAPLGMRASRLIVATLLIPAAGLFAYFFALLWNRDGSSIDSNGSALGVLIVLAATFGISRIAHDDRWASRAGTSIALASAYFLLTWTIYGDTVASPDSSPHLVWFGLCVAAFMPAVVMIPLSTWVWHQVRRQDPA